MNNQGAKVESKKDKKSERLQSKIVKQEPMYEGKWLGLRYTTFSIGEKIVPNYQTVYRTTTKKSGRKIDGVQVIPIIKYKDPAKLSQVVLIANFRPPVGKFTLQFPSGILEDQNYEQNARREVQQETGYVISKFVKLPFHPMYCDPWKSNESGLMYMGIIDGDSADSYKQQQLDNQENIIVHKVQLNEDFMAQISKIIEQNNYALEGKVWSVCMGLTMAKLLKQ